MSHLWRLRVSLADRAGALGQAASIIGMHGGNIMSIDVHSHDGGAIDDLVVEFANQPDLDELRYDLATSAGAELLGQDRAEAVDLVVATLEEVLSLLDAPATDSARALARAVHTVCASSTVWVADAADATRFELGRSALDATRPVVGRTSDIPESITSELEGEVYLLAAPARLPHGEVAVVFVGRRAPIDFTATEVSRIEAILQVQRRLVEGVQAAP